MPKNGRLAVLISGRGSNLRSLVNAAREGALDAGVSVVISNREDAPGLAYARQAGIEALCLDHRTWPSRDDYDRALALELWRRDIGMVCLAGFMRRVGPPLLEAFPDAVLNIHPSLLPSFPGLEAQRQAIAHGVTISGVTVHLVTTNLDDGPIVVQRAVPVLEGDTAETLAARILPEEHRAYPEAVARMLSGQWVVEGRRVVRRP